MTFGNENVSEKLVMAFAVVGVDAGLVLAKFVQMNKLYSRTRMINLNFGTILGAYYKESADIYDKSSKKGKNYVITNSYGHKGKFDDY